MRDGRKKVGGDSGREGGLREGGRIEGGKEIGGAGFHLGGGGGICPPLEILPPPSLEF